MRIEHSHLCTSNATLCAVQNMRDHLQEYTHHSDELPADMTPLQTLELVQEWARSYQDEGLVSCTCAQDTLRKYEADLRQARKALRSHVINWDSTQDAAVQAAKVERVQSLLVMRDELRAHMAGVR